MKEVELTQQSIALFKLLKIEGLVASGGEAKYVISEGQVILNGTIETQKRKKVIKGDIVEFGGETLRINFTPQSPESTTSTNQLD